MDSWARRFKKVLKVKKLNLDLKIYQDCEPDLAVILEGRVWPGMYPVSSCFSFLVAFLFSGG